MDNEAQLGGRVQQASRHGWIYKDLVWNIDIKPSVNIEGNNNIVSRINRYKFTKNIYPDYIVLLTRKNKFITFDIDLKLIDYLEVDEDLTILDKLHINYLVLDDLEIINIKSYKDNNYDKYCLGLVINKVVKKIGNKLIKYY